jgi:hypothetical protein
MRTNSDLSNGPSAYAQFNAKYALAMGPSGDASSRVSRSVTYHTYPGPRTCADRDEGLGMLVALVGRLTFLIGMAISRSLDTEAGVPSSVRIVSPS